IVVHEMCHMEHRNHSKDFYLAVERNLPDYKERVKWLKNNGVRMNF
ncbi:M48 family peptidase, partial [Acinetobacter sp. RIT592]